MNAPAGEALGTRLEHYLARLWNAEVKVRDLARIPGGASRETYRFDADVNGQPRGMILRRDPSGSLIDTEDRKSTRLNSSHIQKSRMPSSA